MKKALAMPIEIYVALVVLIVVAVSVIMFTTGKMTEQPPQTDNTTSFESKCVAFCESKNFTYHSGWDGCLCIDQKNTILEYNYNEEADLFYRYSNWRCD